MISIITITDNDDATLGRTLDSVLAQQYTDIEPIVVDARLHGRSPGFLQQYGRCRFVYRERMGIFDAINHGLHRAGGDIVGLVHGGDRLHDSGVAAHIAAAFDACPTLDYIYGDIMYEHPDGTPGRVYSGRRADIHSLIHGIVPPHPSLYLRRHVAEALGDYRLDMPTAADFDMWARIFTRPGLQGQYLPATIACMSTGGISGRLINRLWYNQLSKLRVLRMYNLPANPLRLAAKLLNLR